MGLPLSYRVNRSGYLLAVMLAAAPITAGIVVSIGVGYLLGKIVEKTELREKNRKFFQSIQDDIEETKRKTK
ncbi:MAG: hypothetical protein AB7T38_17715 [Nitrospirales bacterium]